MRKLAPAFIMTSVLTLACGSALATSPTVDANSNNPQGQSYSDKSSTSPGTNATMDNSKPAMASTTEDDKNLSRTKKATKKKMAMKSSDSTVKSDTSISAPAPSSTPKNSTGATAANSTTGISTGQ